MRFFSEWRADVNYAIENLILEVQGFGDEAKKRRKKKRAQYLSPRKSKIKKLRDDEKHWAGLE